MKNGDYITEHVDVSGCEIVSVDVAGVALNDLQVRAVTSAVLTDVPDGQLAMVT